MDDDKANQPTYEQQPGQSGEELKPGALIDDPDFYRGGASLAGGSPTALVEPYLVRNRARALYSWMRGGVSYNGLWIILGVGGVLIAAMLLLNKGALIG